MTLFLHVLKLIITNDKSSYKEVNIKTESDDQMKYLKLSITVGIDHKPIEQCFNLELDCLGFVKIFISMIVLYKTVLDMRTDSAI